MKLLPVVLLAAVPCRIPPVAAPSIKPHPSANRMANEAECIVEGRVVAADTVAVTRRHFAAPSRLVPERLTVPGLSAMSLSPFEFGRQTKAVQPDSVLLFLRADGDDRFAPLYQLEGAARGVLWLSGERVFGYRQFINPGPYELDVWPHLAAGEVLGEATPADVRTEVEQGLAARAKWQATLAIEGEHQRAAAVARWCSPATSPDGWRWSERCWPDLREQGRLLGVALVPPLAQLVADEPDGQAVGFALALLANLGERARQAAPLVIARLQRTDGASPYDLVRALAAFGDPRAIDVLRDRLGDRDDHLAAEAALGLHRCGDGEAAVRVSERIPTAVDGDHPEAGVVALLDALHEIDADRAVALYRARFADVEGMRAARRWLRELSHDR